MSNLIGFPGLGIEEFLLDRVAFTVFGFDIYWYAIMITSGLILAVGFGFWQCKRFGMSRDNLLDGLLITLPLSIIGARLFFVIFNAADYQSFYDVINIRDGGLGIWGALIVAFPTVIVFCKIKKLDFRSIFDITAIGFFIGQTVGRWGNFFNAEVFGTYTDLPWGMTVNGSSPVHPLFLYESLINLVGLCIVLLVYRFWKNRRSGDIFLIYAAWYGTFRALLEMLRPSQYVLYLFNSGLRTAVLLGFICAGVAVALFIYRRISAFVKAKKDAVSYEKVFNDLEQSDEDDGIENLSEKTSDDNDNKEKN